MVETVERTLRADAQRNLQRILDAARAVFAEEGLEASVADVAARAGVGTATIFRRFPTKDDLIAAVVEARIEEFARSAREAAASDDPDAVRRFMEAAAAGHIGDRGFCEASARRLLPSERLAELGTDVLAGIGDLLQRAQAAGHVRPDVVPQDIPLLLIAVAQVGQRLGPEGRRWKRYLDLVMDGLRPEGATPLSRRAPTPAELERAKRSRAASVAD